MTKVKIVNRSGQPVPAYATPLSAGMDLRLVKEENFGKALQVLGDKGYNII